MAESYGGGGFIESRQKLLFGRVDEIGLFYLHISGSLTTRKEMNTGIEYLNSKDMFRETGYERFKKYLTECGVINN